MNVKRPNHKLEPIMFWCLLLLVVWLPIPLGGNRVWAWSITEVWVALLTVGVLASYSASSLFNRVKNYKLLLTGLALFQCWVALQIIPLPYSMLQIISPGASSIYQAIEAEVGYISLDKTATLVALFKGIGLCLFMVTCIALITTPRRLKQVATAIVIAGSLQAFYAAIMVLIGVKESPVFGYPETNIATGSFIYKNHLANYLLLCLSVGIGLIVTQLHHGESGSWFIRIKRIVTGLLSSKMVIRLCLVIMVIALIMTRSRMGNTAFFVATTTVGVIALLFYKQRPRALTALIVSIIALDTLIIGALFGLEKVKQRIVETSMEYESRDQVVLWSLDIIKDYPLTGTGMSSFYAVFPGYMQGDIGYYDHAHNDYIQFLVEAGIPATLLLGAVVFFTLWRCFITIQTRRSRTMKGIALGSMMAIIGMLIHITVDFNLQPTANAFTFVLILFMANAAATMPVTGINTVQSEASDV